MASKRSAKKKRGETEAHMGLSAYTITNKQKSFIKDLLRDRDYPESAYYTAFQTFVSNPKSVETCLFPGTDIAHEVTSKEASQVITDLCSYPFKKRK